MKKSVGIFREKSREKSLEKWHINSNSNIALIP
jgi:hypothetical protein